MIINQWSFINLIFFWFFSVLFYSVFLNLSYANIYHKCVSQSLCVCMCEQKITHMKIKCKNISLDLFGCVFLFFWHFSFLDHIFSSDPITVYTGFNLFSLDTYTSYSMYVCIFFTIDFFFQNTSTPPVGSFYGLGSVFCLFLFEEHKKNGLITSTLLVFL